MSQKLGSFVHCDASKCTGCKACEIACFAAHEFSLGKTVGNVAQPVKPRVYVRENGAVQCRHCEQSPCLYSCRRGAIRRYEGKVLIDYNKCSACPEDERTCHLACPFSSIVLLPDDKGAGEYASKCDLCIGRLDKGPACVEACPNGALALAEPESETDKRRARAAKLLSYMT